MSYTSRTAYKNALPRVKYWRRRRNNANIDADKSNSDRYSIRSVHVPDNIPFPIFSEIRKIPRGEAQAQVRRDYLRPRRGERYRRYRP